MKIVCEHCGAKYSIADEKVAGKIFKIRCKKCDETLEVRGDQLDSGEGEESTQVYDYGGEAVWYVVIDGEQQGPLAPLQLGALVAKGKASLDSYVWKEGFDDWKVATDVPELATLLKAPVANGDASETGSGIDPDDAPTALSEVGTGAGGSGLSEASLFSGNSEPAPQPQAASGSPSGGNLFAGFDSGDTGGGGMAAASAPMTGQRNENSVLFSLSNLQQLATSHHPGAPEPSAAPAGGPSQPAAAAAPPSASGAGYASGEGSGLIDIRQLAMATSPGTASSAPPSDLLAIGGTSASMTGGLAPVALPHVEEAKRRNMLLWIGGGAALVLLLGTLGYAAFRDKTQVVQVGPGGDVVETPTAPAPTAPEPADPKPVEAAPTAVEPEPEPEPEPEAAAPTIAKPAPKKASRTKRTTSRTAPKTPAKKATNSSAKKKSLDALMDDVLGDKSSSKKASSSGSSSKGSSLPATPSRTDVAKALNGVRGGVRSCKKDKGGVATVSVTFGGKTGKVSSAKVTGPPFRGTSVGSCIERTVKRARVPRFSRRSFNVKFPYRL